MILDMFYRAEFLAGMTREELLARRRSLVMTHTRNIHLIRHSDKPAGAIEAELHHLAGLYTQRLAEIDRKLGEMDT